jgi:hypothetical protein
VELAEETVPRRTALRQVQIAVILASVVSKYDGALLPDHSLGGLQDPGLVAEVSKQGKEMEDGGQLNSAQART